MVRKTSPRPRNNERGQFLILFVVVFTLVLLIGAFAVDQGLFLGQRRDSQKDADTAALAGALEIIKGGNAATIAQQYITNNEPAANASSAGITVDGSCFGGAPSGPDNAVDVKVQYKQTGLFLNAVNGITGGNVSPPDVRAHAKACAGAAQAPGNLVPIETDTQGPCFIAGKPQFGALCPIEYGASGSSGGAARGTLDLQAAPDYCSDPRGSGDPETLIRDGAPGTCLINPDPDAGTCNPGASAPWYDCVAVQTGNAKKIVDGFHERLEPLATGTSVCNGPGFVDDFAHTVDLIQDNADPSLRLYQPADCGTAPGLQISPRLVTIIILKQPPSPPFNGANPIYGFAAFYVTGCSTDSGITDPNDPRLDRYCNAPGSGPVGHIIVYGQFVNLVLKGAAIGPANGATTIFGVSLVQ